MSLSSPFIAGTPLTPAGVTNKFPQSWPASASATPNVQFAQTVTVQSGDITNVLSATSQIIALGNNTGLTATQLTALNAVHTLFSGLSAGSVTFTIAELQNIVTVSQMIRSWANSNINTQTTSAMATLAGIISSLTLSAGGMNYVNGTYTNISLQGGSGSGATANFVVGGTNVESLGSITGGGGYTPGTYTNIPLNGNTISALGTVTGGSGYVNGTYANIALTGGSGTGATAQIVVSGNTVTSAVILDGGSAYAIGDTLSATTNSLGGSGSGFSVPVASVRGSGCEATIVVNGETSIARIIIADGGSGYVSAKYSNVPLFGSSGTGALANITVTGGAITSCVITKGGSGYSVNELVSTANTNLGGSGTGFSVQVTSLGLTGITSLSSQQPGSGYTDGTYTNIPLTGGSGTGATGNFTVTDGATTDGQAVVTINVEGIGYKVGDVLGVGTGIGSGGSGFSCTVGSIGGTNVGVLGITDAGSGYIVGTYTNVPFAGGTGTGAIGTVIVTGGVISTVSVTNGGSGYPNGTFATIPLTGGSGSGATATITVTGGVITSVVINMGNGGANYVDGDLLGVDLSSSISDGTGFVGTVTQITGSVTTAALVSGGNGYSNGDILTIYAANVGGTGTGFSAVVDQLGTTADSSIATISFSQTPGMGYVSGTYTMVPFLGGQGSGAQGTVTVVSGVVHTVQLTEVGTGYSLDDTLTIDSLYLGGSGSGFSATVTSLGGTITVVNLTSYGSGFAVGDVLTVNALALNTGTGFQVPVAQVGGVVESVTITSGGFGYQAGDQLNVLNTDLNGPDGSGFVCTPYSFASNPIVTVGVPFPNGARTIICNDQYFIVDQPNTGNFYISNSGDGTKWNAITVMQIQSQSDTAQAVDYLPGGLVLLFGEYSTEPWYDAETSPLDYARQSGYQNDWGLAATWARAHVDGALVFLGQNSQGQVQIMTFENNVPIPISTEDINNIINGFPTVNDAIFHSFYSNGHEFVSCTFPTGNRSLLWDNTTGLWCEWSSSLAEYCRHLTQLSFSYNYCNYASDATSGNIYFIDSNNNTDNGSLIRREVDTVDLYSDGDPFTIDEVYLQMDMGAGTPAVGTTTPAVRMQVSKNSGPFGMVRTKLMGKIGQRFYPRVIFRTLGQARKFVLKFITTSDSRFIISTAGAVIRKKQGAR